MKLKYFDKLNEKVYSEKLPNGLSVFVVPKEGFAKKYAFFATNYGGADRRYKVNNEWIDTPEGVAHFLEHKMFDTKDGNALEMLSANGASPNAYTSSEMTAYYFSCIDGFDENLKTLLSFVSIPYFTDESVSKEQGIIGQEIRMTDDEPEYSLYFNLMKCLYSNHPLRYSVAGTCESISEITAETLYDCHKIFYNPSNMVLCVVGDVSPEAVIKTASEILPAEKGPAAQRDYGDKESITVNEASSVSYMDIGIPIFAAGFKCGKYSGNSYLMNKLTAAVALKVLIGHSSPLYAKLYAESLISSSFSAEFETVTDQSHVIFSGESNNPDAVVSAIKQEITAVNATGISSKLFEQSKKALTGSVIRALNSFENISAGIASSYFKGCNYFDRIAILNEITKSDVEQFIKEYFTDERFACSIIYPKNIQTESDNK